VASRFRRAAPLEIVRTGIRRRDCSACADEQSSQCPGLAPSSPAARTGGRDAAVIGRHAYTSQRRLRVKPGMRHRRRSLRSVLDLRQNCRAAEFRSREKVDVFRKPGSARARFQPRRWICGAQFSHSGTEARGVKRVDAKARGSTACNRRGMQERSGRRADSASEASIIAQLGIAQEVHKRSIVDAGVARACTGSKECHACAIVIWRS